MRRKTTKTLFLVVLACTALVWAAGVWAQAEETGSTAEAPPPVEQKTTLLTLLRQGGILMWPLGLLSVATIGLAVYGFLTVRADKMLSPDLVPPLQDALQKVDVAEALELCRASPGLLGNIVGAGLQRLTDGFLDVPSMEKAMDEAAVEETASGMKTISYLSIIAQIAPMVGLLGTVSGMIKAFAKIGKGAMGKPEILAADIGEALVTTATGLLIGIPAMFLYFYLKSRYTSNVSRLSRIVGNLTHHLVAATRQPDDATPAITPVPDTVPAGDPSPIEQE